MAIITLTRFPKEIRVFIKYQLSASASSYAKVYPIIVATNSHFATNKITKKVKRKIQGTLCISNI